MMTIKSQSSSGTSDQALAVTRPGFPRRVTNLRMLSSEESPIRHFGIDLLNCHGVPLAERRVYSLECRAQSPVSAIVLWCKEKGELLVECVEAPQLFLRDQLISVDPLRESGTLVRLPSRVPTYGTAMGRSPRVIGGRFFPSVGGSPESAELLRFDITPESLQGYQGLTPQGALTGYCDGSVRDLRLVLAALRLADQEGIPLKLPTAIPMTIDHQSLPADLPVRGAREIAQWIQSSPAPDRVAVVRAAASNPPERPFIKAYSFQDPSGREQVMSVRKGIDAVDVAAFCLLRGIPHLLVKREIRPALAAQRILDGDLSCSVPSTSLGGVAESLEGEESIEAIGERAIEGIREEVGYEAVGAATFIGSSYPSPEFSIERAYHMAAEIDPRTPSGCSPDLDEVVDLAMVPVSDVIALCREGLISDPRLELSARFLHLALPFSGHRY